ncbi:MAG: CoA ester lyase [Alphaproteobacteria bacterium]|nr:CoA ester lyase [Alphaproteobacteria bacterium]
MSSDTSITDRPRRSAMYTPGANERALEKGREVPADILIMDLEDGVAPDAKETARANILRVLGEGGYGAREIGVRINGTGSEWHEPDVEAIATSGANMLVVPKVDSADTVIAIVKLMEAAKAPTDMQIWCMIETAHGVLNVNAIASSHPRVGALLIGSADLTKDLRAQHMPDRLPLMTSIQLCVLAARANGLTVLDSPFFDLSDDEGFLESCRQGRSMGFDGKTLLHPKTVSGANAIFGPSEEEIAWAHKISVAHETALAEGKGVTLVDGQLVEGLHVEEAQRLVQMAKTIKALEAASP